MRGITVTLHQKTQTGTDSFNAPIFVETDVEVENVLIGEPTTDQVVEDLNL